MMKYRLVCSEGHEFEGWFKSCAAYEEQEPRGQISCPHCGTSRVSKAIMAPNVATRIGSTKSAPERQELLCNATAGASQLYAMMRQLRAVIEQHSEYVGPRFAEEARKIYYDESEARGIYGEASADEVRALTEEGIPVLPMPPLREDLN
jgi:hypothetical protein